MKMVKILLAASFSLASASLSSPWIKQFPISTGQQLLSVFFVDPDFGWAAGNQGILLHSENGGADWIAQTSGTTESLAEIQFVDRNRGWAIGGGGIIAHTEDGGATWRMQPSGTKRALYTLKFFGPDTGWVTGEGGTILRTVNGGGKWTSMLDTAEYRYADFRFSSFIDGSTGWANSSWNKLHTGDGGKTWTEIAEPKGMTAIQFLDKQNGWNFDVNTINRTQDGGLTWTVALQVQSGRPPFHFFTPDSGWVCLPTGPILRTADGGKTWLYEPFLGSAFESVFFLDENRGWLIGSLNRSVVRTVDGGKTWSKFDTSQALRSWLSVAAVDSLTAWTVGDSGWMAHTSDGGATWLPQASGTASRLNCVRFLDPRAGWIVGDDGIILHTSDGGNAWRPQTSGTATRLRTLFIASADTGWAGGDSGVLLRTYDGGAHWNRMSNMISEYKVDAIRFRDGKRGLLLLGGRMYRTVNGGATWVEVAVSGAANTSGNIYLTNMHFPVPDTGWVVGANVDNGDYGSGVRKTVDGGNTWFDPGDSTLLEDNLSSVFFRDTRRGWATGHNGGIFYTSDGGKTWSHWKLRGSDWLWLEGAAFSASRGWAVGSGSNIFSLDLGREDAAPALLAPANGAAIEPGQAGLVWTPVTGITGYRAQLATDSLFRHPAMDDTSLNSPIVQVDSLVLGTRYFWRAGYRLPDGSFGPWSAPWSFTIASVGIAAGKTFLAGAPRIDPYGGLRFGLAARARVKATLFDLRGRRSEILIDRDLGAGDYVVQPQYGWSGIRILEFEAGDYRATRIWMRR